MIAIITLVLFAVNAVYGAAAPAPAVIPAPAVVPAPAIIPTARYVSTPAVFPSPAVVPAPRYVAAPPPVPYVSAPLQLASYARAIPQNIPPYASSVNYFGRSTLLPYVPKSAVVSPYVETLPAPLVTKVASPYVAAPYVTSPYASPYAVAPAPFVPAPAPFVPAVV